jgi:pimeloyl-ACP methyl ester carboxylesterase
MTIAISKNESKVTVAGTSVQMFSAGSGPPLLFLHGAGGNRGWQPFHEELAKTHTVYAPSQAGFNGTERPGWVRTITDMAHFNRQIAQQMGLGRHVLMGHSMGGWIAAEMAAMDHGSLTGLVLIDAVGIRPKNTDITEVFMVSAETRAGYRFHDPSQVPGLEEYTREQTPEEVLADFSNRETASRLLWKPYMHNPSLPHYLATVKAPTLVLWGREDAIVPLECGELFQQAISGAQLQAIDRCGHSPQYERPEEFHRHVSAFLGGLT